MNPKFRNVLILIALLLILSSLVMDVYAAEKIVVKDGEDVVETVNHQIYIGSGMAFGNSWVTLYNPRYPKTPGRLIGAVTFPVQQVLVIYHQGEVNLNK
jgi:hypothetical protein